MKTIQAYRFALDLTSRQERDLLANAGAARSYNHDNSAGCAE